VEGVRVVRGRGVREEECFLLEEDRGLGTGGSSTEKYLLR
jgi:hypothetical protein